ncbi:MAG: YbaB/EbfC family nucleoid-associated protein [Maricaulaceae bacterium]|nr:YbaB/EbfC family nucleoid-associated protein [Maricaulaceae bacterium]
MGLMKQARDLQQKMAEAQAKLDSHEVTGESGAGMVRVTLTAKGEARAVKIDPSLFDKEAPEMLEDLILAAHADARRKAEEAARKIMAEAAGGLQLPPGLIPGM